MVSQGQDTDHLRRIRDLRGKQIYPLILTTSKEADLA